MIPVLNEQGSDPDVKHFTLTHEKMTRFVMTLEQSVDLIEHAILCGDSGDVVIPKIISMKVKDLMEIFSEKYNKPIVLGKLSVRASAGKSAPLRPPWTRRRSGAGGSGQEDGLGNGVSQLVPRRPRRSGRLGPGTSTVSGAR